MGFRNFQKLTFSLGEAFKMQITVFFETLQVKATCGETFTQYAMCLEQSRGLANMNCRNIQAKFDTCMKDNLGMDRPPLGYYSLIRVHESDR